MKNILVTGGNGFIGAYLVDRLIKERHKVVVIDNNTSIGGILYSNPKVKFINSDIKHNSTYHKLKNFQFDTVYHLAAQSAGETSYDDPKNDILTNTLGTYLLAKYCVESKVKKIIYTSTVAVYGNQKDVINEDCHIEPDSIYGASKYNGELLLKQLTKNTKTAYTIFRVFNVYGPGENLNFTKKGMVSIYLSYVWKKKPIIVKGSTQRFRDLTFISDTIEALILAKDNFKTINQTYNLSSGKKYRVHSLIKKIIKIFELPIDYSVIIESSTQGDSFGYHSDTRKIQKDLDWKSKVSLEEGLLLYREWLKKVPTNQNLRKFHPLFLDKIK